MLPVWPMMGFAGAAMLVSLWHRHSVWGRAVATALAVGVMTHGLWFAVQHDVLAIGRTESRYPQIARIVAGATDPTAAVISAQHSVSLRYYGSRVTLRWDFMEGSELDTAVAWLAEHGHRPYLLLDASEVKDVRARFAGHSTIGALDWTPRYSFFNGETLLFDVADRGRSMTTTLFGSYTTRTILPAPRQPW